MTQNERVVQATIKNGSLTELRRGVFSGKKSLKKDEGGYSIIYLYANEKVDHIYGDDYKELPVVDGFLIPEKDYKTIKQSL